MNEWDYYEAIQIMDEQLKAVQSLIAVVEQDPVDDWDRRLLKKARKVETQLKEELIKLGDLEHEQRERKRREWRDPLLPI